MASLAFKREQPSEEVDVPEERFPSLFLDGAQVEALGLTSDDMEKEMVMTAKVKVTSFSVSESPKRKRMSASLSFMDGTVERKKSESEKASSLFE